MEQCVICTEHLNDQQETIALACCKVLIHKSCWESWIVGMCPHCRNTDVYQPPPISRIQVLKNFADKAWNAGEANFFNSNIDMKSLTPKVFIKVVYFESYIGGNVLKKVEKYFKLYCRMNRKYWVIDGGASVDDLQIGLWHSLLYAFDLLDELDELE